MSLPAPSADWFSYAAAGSTAGFLVCVVVATIAQTLTGFAFGLILLGLVSLLNLATVADAANASTVLSLVNAVTYFRHHHEPPPVALMKPAMGSSLVGVLGGLFALHWLSSNANTGLRILLGVAIAGCAIALMLRTVPRAQMSGPGSLATVGLLSGLLGGLFGVSGPPLVYHMHRQPLPMETIRSSLLLMFAINAAARLVMVIGTGHFSLRAVALTALSLPLVIVITRQVQRHPPPFTTGTLRKVVVAMLLLSGGSLVATAISALIKAG